MMIPETYNVTRAGEKLIVEKHEIQTGDLIELSAGMKCPVEALLVVGEGIQTDESEITGEPDQMSKAPLEEKDSENSPHIMGGSFVTCGEGKAVVLYQREDPSMAPLQVSEEQNEVLLRDEKISLQTKMRWVGLIVAILCMIILFLKNIIEQGIRGFDMKNRAGDFVIWWVRYVLLALTLIEITSVRADVLSLARQVRRGLMSGLFYKRLSCVGVMSKVTCLVSDKTGLIQEKSMEVREIWSGKYMNSSECYKSKQYGLIKENICCNSTGDIYNSNTTTKALLMYIESRSDIEQIKA